MSRRNPLSRRTVLFGTGSVVVALPFLEEMLGGGRAAAASSVPERALTMFFGLGVPTTISEEGFTTALRPLERFADKLSILPYVSLQSCESPAQNHFDGAGGVFVGRPPQGEYGNAGGPSIDQVLKRAWYPKGVPTQLDTLMFGTFFRRSEGASATPTRYVHCWAEDGSPVDQPIETPAALFDRLFGIDPTVDPAERSAKRSILDGVLSHYAHVRSPRYGLGAASLQRLEAHLDKIRELERRIFPEDVVCQDRVPDPGHLPLLHGQAVDDGGPTLDVAEWTAYWQAAVDLFAVAVRCDLVRFGNMMFESGGERAHLVGDYSYEGEYLWRFNDTKTWHEYWHGWNPALPDHRDVRLLRRHQFFVMDRIATFLAALDDPAWPDANGKTILENAFVMIGTELGYPGDNFHGLDNVWHAVGPAGGRLRTDQFVADAPGCVDLYNTCLQAMGTTATMGDVARWSTGPVGVLLP